MRGKIESRRRGGGKEEREEGPKDRGKGGGKKGKVGGGSAEAADFRPSPHLLHPTKPTATPCRAHGNVKNQFIKIRRKNVLIMNLAWVIFIFVPKQWLNIIDIQKTIYLMCTTW